MSNVLYPATAAKAEELRSALAAWGVKGARVRRMPSGSMRLVLKSVADRDAARDALVMVNACTACGVAFTVPDSRHAWNGPTEIFVRFLEAYAYWYRIDYFECPVCGREHSYRERQYTSRPDNPSDRIFFHHDYCGCLEA
jgi:predicted RNA-binding Zn-ribbon protein involved in translation (DUF1610 family)